MCSNQQIKEEKIAVVVLRDLNLVHNTCIDHVPLPQALGLSRITDGGSILKGDVYRFSTGKYILY